MPLPDDRVTGLAVLLLGLLLYFVVIPTYVASVSSGWVLPATIPNAVAVVLIVCGGLLMLKPTSHRSQGKRELAFAGLYYALFAAGLVLMSYTGFVYAAPLLALAIMLLTGERRPVWLGLGTIVMPAMIWFLVAHVLQRALP